jgi:hypothetical protein
MGTEKRTDCPVLLPAHDRQARRTLRHLGDIGRMTRQLIVTPLWASSNLAQPQGRGCPFLSNQEALLAGLPSHFPGSAHHRGRAFLPRNSAPHAGTVYGRPSDASNLLWGSQGPHFLQTTKVQCTSRPPVKTNAWVLRGRGIFFLRGNRWHTT